MGRHGGGSRHGWSSRSNAVFTMNQDIDRGGSVLCLIDQMRSVQKGIADVT